jgi:hypothetical protein
MEWIGWQILQDEACKYMCLFDDMYSPERWEMFLERMEKACLTGQPMDMTTYYDDVLHFSQEWDNKHDKFPTVPTVFTLIKKILVLNFISNQEINRISGYRIVRKVWKNSWKL